MPSITQPAAPCHIPSEPAEEVLLGVDTHKDVHAAAMVTVLGAVLDGRSFPATAEGYRQPGHGRSAHCGGPASSAPAPMVQPWPVTCARKASR
ncbi:hypothetical protein [Streptomyces sp. NPDC056255]|uniref:hypothetical protein n=1 Tax=Streptomyces sp. NPDC056255 TaxID=3345764 RepID=UPI0035DD9073